MTNGMFVFYIAGIAERRPQVLYGDEVNLPISTHPPTHAHTHTHTHTHPHTHTPTHVFQRRRLRTSCLGLAWQVRLRSASAPLAYEWIGHVHSVNIRDAQIHVVTAASNPRGGGGGGWVGCVMQHEMQQLEVGYHAHARADALRFSAAPGRSVHTEYANESRLGSLTRCTPARL